MMRRHLRTAMLAFVMLGIGLTGLAEAQGTVTRSNLILRTRLAPGTTNFPTVTVEKAYQRVLFQIDPHPADWADPGFLVTLTIEQLVDGAWVHANSITVIGNSFQKDGSLPGIQWTGSRIPPVGTQLRGSVTINAQFRVGVVLEVEEVPLP